MMKDAVVFTSVIALDEEGADIPALNTIRAGDGPRALDYAV